MVLLFLTSNLWQYSIGDNMKVRAFDANHELDLQDDVNEFLKGIREEKIVDIKYCVSVVGFMDKEQIYCFSALVIYKD